MKRRLFFLMLIAALLPAMLPTVAVAAPSQCDPIYHRVQRGETLFGIATRYGVNMWAIAHANGIANPNCIYAGQLLVIPCAAPTPPPSTCIHIVRRGEWLYQIARRYGVSPWAIVSANGITNPNCIYPGQRLVMPSCEPYPPLPLKWRADEEGVVVIVPWQGRAVKVVKLPLGPLELRRSDKDEFQPMTPVINFEVVDAETCECEMLSEFNPPIELEVRYKEVDVQPAQYEKKPVLGFWNDEQQRWIAFTAEKHGFWLEERPEGWFGHATVSSWGDRLIAWGW